MIVGAVLIFSLSKPLHRKFAVLITALCIGWTFVEVESQYRANAESAGYSPESLRTLLNSETEPLSRFVKTILFGPERVVKFFRESYADKS